MSELASRTGKRSQEAAESLEDSGPWHNPHPCATQPARTSSATKTASNLRRSHTMLYHKDFPNVWCESFSQYFEMHLALSLTDTEKQLLFPLWSTHLRTTPSCPCNLEALRYNPFSLSSVSLHSQAFRYLTLLTALLHPVSRRSASFSKRDTQRWNQTPAEAWPTLSEVKSMSPWPCQPKFVAQGCSIQVLVILWSLMHCDHTVGMVTRQ